MPLSNHRKEKVLASARGAYLLPPLFLLSRRGKERVSRRYTREKGERERSGCSLFSTSGEKKGGESYRICRKGRGTRRSASSLLLFLFDNAEITAREEKRYVKTLGSEIVKLLVSSK